MDALRLPWMTRAAHSPYARVAPDRVIAATRMPRMTRNTRMLTFPPTLSSMTANIVRMDSRRLPPEKSSAPEKMPMMSDM